MSLGCGDQAFDFDQQVLPAEVALEKEDLIRGERRRAQGRANGGQVGGVAHVHFILRPVLCSGEVPSGGAVRMGQQRVEILNGFSGLFIREPRVVAGVADHARCSGDEEL